MIFKGGVFTSDKIVKREPAYIIFTRKIKITQKA